MCRPLRSFAVLQAAKEAGVDGARTIRLVRQEKEVQVRPALVDSPPCLDGFNDWLSGDGWATTSRR
jgi:hypothetical protein